MSIRVMSSLWDLELNPTVKLVLLALADCANDEGLAWPSIATLARKASVGERTVQRSLVEARTLGIINREEVIGRGCKYTFTPFTPRHAGTPATVSPVTNDAETPATLAPHPRHAGTQSVIEPLEPSIDAKASKRAREQKPDIVIPDWIPQPAWSGWLASRKAKATPHVVELAIGKLEKLRRDGHDPGEVLNQSSLNGWRGLFPLKESQNGRLQADRANSGKPRGGPVDGFTAALRQVRDGQPDGRSAGSDDATPMCTAQAIGYQPH